MITKVNRSSITIVSQLLEGRILSFKELYYELNEDRKRILRNCVREICELSYSHFFRRMREQNWKKLEKEAISQLLKRPVNELFPIGESVEHD